MLGRRTTGSVVCPGCGSLVGVRDAKCYTCGRSNPGLWGFAPALRSLGQDLGFVPLVVGGSAVLYVLSLLTSGTDALIFALRGLGVRQAAIPRKGKPPGRFSCSARAARCRCSRWAPGGPC